MFVEPQTFDMQMEYLVRRFDVIPLSEWSKERPPLGKKGRPACVITFDDGWSDFYEFAFPILRRWSLPATVFLPTGFIGTDRSFWTDQLAQAIFHSDELDLPIRDTHRDVVGKYIREIKGMTGPYEKRLERAIALLKAERIELIERVIEAFGQPSSSSTSLGQRSFVDWSEVSSMRSSGLISFGSHTENHPILTTLGEDEVRREIRVSFDSLIARGAASPEFLAFCYPNGNFSDRIAEIVREEGGHLALTTENGWAARNSNVFTLRRIGVHQDIASTRSMFGARIAGYF